VARPRGSGRKKKKKRRPRGLDRYYNIRCLHSSAEKGSAEGKGKRRGKEGCPHDGLTMCLMRCGRMASSRKKGRRRARHRLRILIAYVGLHLEKKEEGSFLAICITAAISRSCSLKGGKRKRNPGRVAGPLRRLPAPGRQEKKEEKGGLPAPATRHCRRLWPTEGKRRAEHDSTAQIKKKREKKRRKVANLLERASFSNLLRLTGLVEREGGGEMPAGFPSTPCIASRLATADRRHA